MDAKQTQGEPRLLISRDALLHNAAILRQAVASDVKLCAVVKADAYGHGADLVVDTLYNFSTDLLEAPFVDALAVATVDEAEALPASALQTFVLRPVENAYVGGQRTRIESAIRNGWVLTVCSAAAAGDVARIAISAGRRANVQVMVDTGMSRTGVSVDDCADLLATISSHAFLKPVAVATHFSEAERRDGAFTVAQLDRFHSATDEAVRALNKKGTKVIRHAANSAAAFFHPAAHFDMVRPGIALYGLDPTFSPSMDRPLKPVMKWTAPLTGVRDVKAGTPVGYGQTWVAPRDTKIGLVPIGYADGYLRCLSNKASMIVNRKPAPVVGTISMDSVTLDLGFDSQAVVGDEVTVLDDDPLSPASACALAQLAGTIPYEILCRIGPRVARVVREVEVEARR